MTVNNTNGTSVVRHSGGLHVFLWTVFPIVGGIAGLLLSQLPGWVERLPWAPAQDMIAPLAEFIGPITTIVLVALGVVAGCVLALMSYDDIVTVEVTDEAATITRAADTKTFQRAQIATVFTDGKKLVFLGPDTKELAREKTDHKATELRSAFEAQGYPWHKGDPHAAEFTRWVDGMPGLGEHANALLRARQTALDAEDSADTAELHAELAKLGIVVRDDTNRQYWRLVPNHAD